MAGNSTTGSILDCPVCNEMFETPRILPCQHTICEKCLSSHILDVTRNRSKATKQFSCPVCKRNTKLKNATTFQKNLTISALLDSKALKTRIKNASLKKRAVTIETQTSIEDSAKVLDDTASSTGVKGTRNSGSVVSKPENRKRATSRAPGTGNFVELRMPLYYWFFVDIVNASFFEALFDIYLMFIFDLLLCVCLYFVPLLTSLLICYDLLGIIPRWTSMPCYFSKKDNIFKKKKWWHTGLLINLNLISNWIHGIYQSLLWVIMIIVFTSIFTFFDAITNVGSVFTIETVVHNLMSFISNVGQYLNRINEKVSNITCNLLERTFFAS